MDLTHKGWFGFCPVFIGGLDSDAPLIVERHWMALPLFMLSEAIFSIIFMVCSMLDPEFQPTWPIRITGEIDAD